MEKKYLDRTGLVEILSQLKGYLDANEITDEIVESWGFIKTTTSGLVFEYDPDSNALNISGSNISATYDPDTKTFNLTTT